MKVIQTSNYNLDDYPETLCSFEGLTKKEAEDIAEKLNHGLNGDCPIWHTVVNDDYVLCEGPEA